MPVTVIQQLLSSYLLMPNGLTRKIVIDSVQGCLEKLNFPIRATKNSFFYINKFGSVLPGRTKLCQFPDASPSENLNKLVKNVVPAGSLPNHYYLMNRCGSNNTQWFVYSG